MSTQLQIDTQNDDFQALFRFYREKCSYRNDALFLKFLPTGYRATTLSCVSAHFIDRVILAKLHLGMLITFYDDFADNPKLQNAALLEELYKVPYATATINSTHLSRQEQGLLQLGLHLGNRLLTIIQNFPQYEVFADFFQFDLCQFYQCNRFSQLVTSVPSAANCLELSTYGPHNMGMIAAGTIDLMGTETIQLNELGVIRTVLTLGQRIGRICNMLTTYEREVAEHDMTNELQVMRLEDSQFSGTPLFQQLGTQHPSLLQKSPTQLQQERETLFAKIEKLVSAINTFDVLQYMKGLRDLQYLHEQMTHEI